jgi:hypothetical protein
MSDHPAATQPPPENPADAENEVAKLNALSSRLSHVQELEEGLSEILDAIIHLLGADKGP